LEPHLAEVSLKDIKKTDSSDPSLGCTTAKFDIVSCQFSMHYAFNSEERVRAFLKNVSNSLAPGGVFVGTTVHDVEILRRRDAALAGGTTSNDSTIEFGNSVYRATFSAKGRVVTSSPFSKHCVVGEPYTISVEQSVAGAEEYIVPWKAFVHLCAQSEYNLKLVECDNFDVIAKRFENTDMGQRIMRHVCGGQAKRERESVESVVSGGSIRRFAMSEDEAETAKLFRGFIFQKV
jgi:SAM-dependent methyltransferase